MPSGRASKPTFLPRDFPPWKSVYHWFRKWRIDGTFEHRLPQDALNRLGALIPHAR